MPTLIRAIRNLHCSAGNPYYFSRLESRRLYRVSVDVQFDWITLYRSQLSRRCREGPWCVHPGQWASRPSCVFLKEYRQDEIRKQCYQRLPTSENAKLGYERVLSFVFGFSLTLSSATRLRTRLAGSSRSPSNPSVRPIRVVGPNQVLASTSARREDDGPG